MKPHSLVGAILLFLLQLDAIAQLTPLAHFPPDAIFSGSSRVSNLAVAGNGDLYIKASRDTRGAILDTFQLVVQRNGQSSFELVHHFLGSPQQGFAKHELVAAENSVYITTQYGLARADRNGLVAIIDSCLPRNGNVRFIHAASDSVLLFSAYDTVDVPPNSSGGCYSSNLLAHNQCEQIYRKQRNRFTGVCGGYASRSPSDVVEMFEYRGASNDTMLRRLNGEGVYTDIVVRDRLFEPRAVFGYTNGWIVVGTSTNLTETIYKLDSNFLVVESMNVPKNTTGVPGSYRSLKMSGNHVTYATSSRVMVFDVSQMRCTELSVASIQTGLPDSSWGEMIEEALYHSGYLYVTMTVQGLRVFRDQATAVAENGGSPENRTQVLRTSAIDGSVFLAGDFSSPQQIAAYDVCGKARQVQGRFSQTGVSIDLHELFLGLNLIRMSNGSVYVVLR